MTLQWCKTPTDVPWVPDTEEMVLMVGPRDASKASALSMALKLTLSDTVRG